MMPKTRERHKKKTYTKGDLVEYVGRDALNRGIGIVLEELECYLLDNNVSEEDTRPRHETCVKVYWQGLDKEEIIHKAYVKRVIEIIKYNSKPKK